MQKLKRFKHLRQTAVGGSLHNDISFTQRGGSVCSGSQNTNAKLAWRPVTGFDWCRLVQELRVSHRHCGSTPKGFGVCWPEIRFLNETETSYFSCDNTLQTWCWCCILLKTMTAKTAGKTLLNITRNIYYHNAKKIQSQADRTCCATYFHGHFLRVNHCLVSD